MKATITTGKIRIMRNLLFSGIVTLLLFAQCRHTTVNESVVTPKAQVEAVPFSTDTLSEEISFQAQSGYLVKNIVQAPIDCYIQKTFVAPGDKVRSGQLLYEIITKEKKATEGLNDTIYKGMGTIAIKAAQDGIVTSMRSQTGDFVLAGSEMCLVSSVSSLIFTMQVPAEYSLLVKPGGQCNIILADGSTISGTIKNEFGEMSLNGQTRQYLVKPSNRSFIPENMVATVIITSRKNISSQVLPLSCLLSDEMMQNTWVMKLVNDSTAVKVTVKTGLKNKDKVEILEPAFAPGDLILSAGNYGLTDTALVHVEKR